MNWDKNRMNWPLNRRWLAQIARRSHIFPPFATQLSLHGDKRTSFGWQEEGWPLQGIHFLWCRWVLAGLIKLNEYGRDVFSQSLQCAFTCAKLGLFWNILVPLNLQINHSLTNIYLGELPHFRTPDDVDRFCRKIPNVIPWNPTLCFGWLSWRDVTGVIQTVHVSTVLIQSVKIQWDFIEIQRGVPCSDTAKWYAHWRWCDLRQELKKKFEP